MLFVLATASTYSAAVADGSSTPDDAQHARTLLEKLVAIPSVEGRGRVPQVAQLVARELRAAGFARNEVQIIPVGGTVALLARWPGSGDGKPIVISVHMDVVEAKPEEWQRDPFMLSEANGFFYGRGSIDDKFDLAMATLTLARLRREGYQPGRTLILAASGDEETTMTSTRLLADRIGDAELVLVGDGTASPLDASGKPIAFHLQAAEKTYATFKLEVSNPGGHSSRPRKDNAIYALARTLTRIEEHAFPVQISPLIQRYFESVAPLTQDETGVAMAVLARDTDNADAISTLSANAEINALIRTTCVATTLNAGHAENALPQTASALVNCRLLPGTRIDAVQQQLVQLIDDESVKINLLERFPETSASPLRDDVLAAFRKAVDVDHAGLPIVPVMANGASDAMYYRARGIPSYSFLSVYMRPEDDFAHGLDERVPADAIAPSLRFWNALLREISGK